MTSEYLTSPKGKTLVLGPCLMMFRDLRDKEEGWPLGHYSHSPFPLLWLSPRACIPCVELETSGLTMDLPSTFSSAIPPWRIGKWLSSGAGHPHFPQAVGQRVKARLLFFLFFLQSNVDIHLLIITINEHFYLDWLLWHKWECYITVQIEKRRWGTGKRE